MDHADGIRLARDLVAREFVDRGMVADLNVHWDMGEDGLLKSHPHVMLGLRQIGEGGVRSQGAAVEQDRAPNPLAKVLGRTRQCRERNLVERFLSYLKHFHRVATPYDMLAAKFLAMFQFASMRIPVRMLYPCDFTGTI